MTTEDAFIASNGWLVKFLFHKNFATKEDKNSTNRSVPSYGQILRFGKNRVISMDETALWSGMVGNTTVNATGAKDILLQSTGKKCL